MVPAHGVGARMFAIGGPGYAFHQNGLRPLRRRGLDVLIYCGETLDRLGWIPPVKPVEGHKRRTDPNGLGSVIRRFGTGGYVAGKSK